MNLHLIRKNLGRKKLRTTFTLASVLIAFLLFTVLGALDRAFSLGLEFAGADRLITQHRVSFIEPLPYAYVNRVAAVDGVKEVLHQSWFGAYYQDPKQQFGLFPGNLEVQRRVYPEFTVPDDQWEALMNNRTGLLIGRDLAESYGFELGDRVPISSTIWTHENGSQSWDFVIEAIFEQEDGNEMQAFMHYDYFNEARQFGKDSVGWIVTQIDDPDQADRIRAEIDSLFANSPVETKTSTEEGWVIGFAAQVGNIGLIVRAVLACVFFTLLLVAGNTMAQAVRERTSELAVLKTIGFGDGRILWMVLGESLAIAVLGGALGLGAGYLFVTGAADATSQFLPGFAVPDAWLAAGAGLAVLLGLVTGILPGLRAMRMRVVDALARA